MAGVQVPEKKPGALQTYLPMAAAMLPGPAGMVASVAAKKMTESKSGQAGGVSSEASAMQRRMPEIASGQVEELAQAEQAAGQLPPDMAKQYQPALAEARRRAQAGQV